ncbi:MAG: SWIM zinc finger family protein [Polyangiaceae bacterium]
MTARNDLAGLSDAQLAALGNVGLLKRARREVEAGRGPSIALEADGTLVASSPDGAVSRIGRDIQSALGSCSCGAPRACRHRIAAILVYQRDFAGAAAGAWDPGAFEDGALEQLLGAKLMATARREQAAAIAIQVQPGATPAAELPTATVSFWARDDLHLARCDCGRKPCEHLALAVWAFRKAPEGGLVVLGEAIAEAAGACFSRIERALGVLVEDGFAALGDTRALAEARAAARHEGFVWLADALEDLERDKERYDRQSTVFRIERVVAGVAELSARIRAATTPSPALPRSFVLGSDAAGTSGRIDRLRLIGIGCAIEADGPRRIARAYFVEPISTTVLSLYKEWDFTDRQVPTGAALGDLFASSRRGLRELCAGYNVARGARRRDNGLLDLERARSLQPSNPAGAMWSEIEAPIRIESLAAYGEELDARPPALLGPRMIGRGVHVLPIAEVVALGYSASHQEVVGVVADAEGTPCILRVQHRDASPGRLDAVYRCLGEGAPLVAGRIQRTELGFQLRPLAFVDGQGQVVVPDIEGPRQIDKASRPELFTAASETSLFGELRHLVERTVHRGLGGAQKQALRDLAQRFEGAGLLRFGRLVERAATKGPSAFRDLVVASALADGVVARGSFAAAST